MQQVATIPLPVDNANDFFYYPYGFSIGSDGTFWIPQPNSQNIIHLDASYNEIASYSVAGMTPESASIGTDGNVYFTGLNGFDGTGIYQLNPTHRRREFLRLLSIGQYHIDSTWRLGDLERRYRIRWPPLRLQRQLPAANRLLRHKPGPDRSERQRLDDEP